MADVAAARADLDAAWNEWLLPTGPNGKRSQSEQWRRDNPAEWKQLRAYRDGLGGHPTLVTHTGRQMVEETDAWRALAPTPDPTPTPNWKVLWQEDFAGGRWASWWSVAGPSDGARVVDDGEGGKALELRTPLNAPGGAGILSALWTGDGTHSQGHDGDHNLHTFEMMFPANYNGWLYEPHENAEWTGNTIYSNALGILPDHRLYVQQTGGLDRAPGTLNKDDPGYPHLGGKPQGEHSWSPAPLAPLQWHQFEIEFIGSSDHLKGLFAVKCDGIPMNDQLRPVKLPDGTTVTLPMKRRGTLITNGSQVDELARGYYGYPFQPIVGGSTWIRFRKIKLLIPA